MLPSLREKGKLMRSVCSLCVHTPYMSPFKLLNQFTDFNQDECYNIKVCACNSCNRNNNMAQGHNSEVGATLMPLRTTVLK